MAMRRALAQHIVEHFLIESGLFLHGHGIGAAAARHAIEAHRAAFEGELGEATHLGHLLDAEMLHKHLRGQLSGGQHAFALGQLTQQPVDVGLLHDFEVLVGGVVLRATNAQPCVEDGHARFGEKGFERLEAERLVLLVDEMQLVAEEHVAEDSPHVVLKVGIIPRHAPAFGCWRKRAEHQQPRIFGQPRLKGVRLDGLWRGRFDGLHHCSVLTR